MPRKCDPTDEDLYESVKERIYEEIPKHSAYRSGHVVKTYKKEFSEKHGSRKSPYKDCNKKKTSLGRWYKEDWKSDTGKYKYTSKGSIYRPSKRITKDTPTTHGELTEKEIRRAKREKRTKGRVKRFRSKSKRSKRRSKKCKSKRSKRSKRRSKKSKSKRSKRSKRRSKKSKRSRRKSKRKS